MNSPSRLPNQKFLFQTGKHKYPNNDKDIKSQNNSKVRSASTGQVLRNTSPTNNNTGQKHNHRKSNTARSKIPYINAQNMNFRSVGSNTNGKLILYLQVLINILNILCVAI